MSALSTAAERFVFAPLSILGRQVVGVVTWNVNDTCNYRCSYCTQRHMAARTWKIEDIDRYVRALSALPGTWEIKLSGGEPFQQPGLEDIARGLVDLGHVVSVQTNFSASAAKLARFLEATEGALHVFSASLHLEYASAEGFVARYASELRPWVERHGVRFNVTSVAAPARLAQLRDEVAPRFAAAGIAFKVQPDKVRGRVREYSAEERQALLALGGHNLTGEVAPDYFGRLCWAGGRYLAIKSDGQVWRCYPASRFGGRFARLGSLHEGFELLDAPKVCPYTYCNCTVPIHRGMIEGVPRTLGGAAPTAPEERPRCS
ncbi:MAG: hypothetical protein CSA66_03405 [Proteobacteria bacterium]|nr:MAG: hypothetical protein CSA66_03405 [Pseudomonadota bacterium]